MPSNVTKINSTTPIFQYYKYGDNIRAASPSAPVSTLPK